MKRRISEVQGVLMLSVAFVLDLIPALVFLLAFALVLPGLLELGSCVESGIWATAKCTWNGGLLFVRGALAATLYMFFIAPSLYAILSIVVGIFGLALFTGWFYLSRVPIWGFKSTRIVINLFSLIVELLPVISLLPGITFFVWRHIALSRAEDKKNALELRIVGRRRAAAQADRYAGVQQAGMAAQGYAAAPNVVTFPQGSAPQSTQPRYTTRIPLQDSSVSGVVVPFPGKSSEQSETLPLAA